jgi:MFS superfamily sulfate permease-like transporter
MVTSAGGRSQLASLTTSVIVVIVLLFLTVPLSYMPDAVLSSVVFLIGVELVDVKGMRSILAQRPVEFWVALVTAAVVVFIGVEQGILLAIILSLLVHVQRGYKPKNLVLVEEADHLRSVPVTSPAQVEPGLMVYRFNHSMYYANTELLSTEVLDLLKVGPAPVTWFCIDMAAVDDVDFSAAATLREIYSQLKSRGIQLVFAEVSDSIRAEMDRSGVIALVGPEAFYPSLGEVLAAYREKTVGS